MQKCGWGLPKGLASHGTEQQREGEKIDRCLSLFEDMSNFPAVPVMTFCN